MDLKDRQSEWYRQWREDGDRRAHAALVESFAGLVYRASAAALPSGIPRDDLVSEGFAAVCDAIERFDPDRGKLSGLVYHTIRQHLDRLSQEMSHAVSSSKSRPERRLRWHLSRKVRNYLSEGYSDPVALELAARDLGVSVDHAACSLAMRNSVSMSRSDDGEEGGLELASDDPGADEVLDRSRVRSVIAEAFVGLDERERRVLTGMLLTTPAISMDALAAEFGVTRRRVGQIRDGAMEHVRFELTRRGLEFGDLVEG